MNNIIDVEKKEQKYIRKSIFLLFIFSFLALSLAMIFNIANLSATDFYTYLAILIVIVLSTILTPKITKADNILLMIVNMLFAIGVAMIYRINPSFGKRQLQFYLIGIVLFFLTFFILRTFKFWNKISIFYVIVSVGLFMATLVFGSYIGGAKNWIVIGPVTIQPSEFIKVPLAFFVASFYSRYNEISMKPFGRYYMNIVIYIFIGFLFLQKDLGTALIFFGLMILAQFVYEKDRVLITINILAMILGSILAYFMFGHVRIRVATWLDPWSDINATGYQITQALFATASGGLFGTGIGLGHPDYIPVAESDFIFSAISEEMGVFMGLAVILLFMILVYRAFKISLIQQDKFFSILAFCIGVLFAFQTFIILGGVLKIIPLTGVTLPFISQGGSSMLSGFILLGCLQYCASDIKYGDEIDE
ncbi:MULTISPECIES: FtsW/RodA/SpoVE family cell cycle protein [Anaerococcus]|jgi:cell cycle protein|uniref:Cell cycle protein n=1 Tax=Anaerococcus octavius TaxID=54007 RepID=A0A2I1M9U7_9FIRM|nr:MULTISPECIES: FtsW/RodA/SpoVE family cell cycle protein [Anaerococcus]MBS6105763.1 FtsW/RodA/SpoVE family cell cycle protein [Anaerococcus sp.]MDU3176266.1 FtsW/RodA/SpoVE family cell cycle protein [Anaerococcus sp.]MDU4025431.1 FtsW/RodA/SpoVE family cell cycle protein [Anaerococcus sp.]MDU5229029.1 FtsW/RodA/SpoVE family cell cycle protein [Anaerococcus sp.]MDU7411345.1 FtsW/RodA/SpoVE family cell cycle protein [Anaerococcus sp.]